MPHSVKSGFSISSPRLGAEYLSHRFAWPVIEATSPDNKIPAYITVFDIGAGQHERVDHHLEALGHILLSHERELQLLCDEDCKYALWIYYEFPAAEGAINIPSSTHVIFAMFRIEVIFHLRVA